MERERGGERRGGEKRKIVLGNDDRVLAKRVSSESVGTVGTDGVERSQQATAQTGGARRKQGAGSEFASAE